MKDLPSSKKPWTSFPLILTSDTTPESTAAIKSEKEILGLLLFEDAPWNKLNRAINKNPKINQRAIFFPKFFINYL